ncbi:hypothetical protein D9M68_908670 [compost metagenome]
MQQRSSVDLPAPLEPISASDCPAGTAKLMSVRTGAPVMNALPTPRTSRSGVIQSPTKVANCDWPMVAYILRT